MNIEVYGVFKCLNKCEPIEKRDGSGFSYQLMVMQSNDCGKISVSKDIYDGVKNGDNFTLSGAEKTFEGKKYLSWSKLVESVK